MTTGPGRSFLVQASDSLSRDLMTSSHTATEYDYLRNTGICKKSTRDVQVINCRIKMLKRKDVGRDLHDLRDLPHLDPEGRAIGPRLLILLLWTRLKLISNLINYLPDFKENYKLPQNSLTAAVVPVSVDVSQRGVPGGPPPPPPLNMSHTQGMWSWEYPRPAGVLTAVSPHSHVQASGRRRGDEETRRRGDEDRTAGRSPLQWLHLNYI